MDAKVLVSAGLPFIAVRRCSHRPRDARGMDAGWKPLAAAVKLRAEGEPAWRTRPASSAISSSSQVPFNSCDPKNPRYNSTWRAGRTPPDDSGESIAGRSGEKTGFGSVGCRDPAGDVQRERT